MTNPRDTELLAQDVSQSINRYIQAAEKDPEGHSIEWEDLLNLSIRFDQFLIRTRPRKVA